MNQPGSRASAGGRRQFLLIVALFFGPLLAAVGWYVLAPQVAPAPDTHGTLIDPARPLEPFRLPPAAAGGAAFTLDSLRGRWSLLQVIDRACEADCRERLHFTRQIRAALGRDRPRVQRIVLAASGPDTPGVGPLLADHPDLVVLTMQPGRPLRGQLPGDLDASTVLLVDPLGNLMLRFGAAVEPGGILEDLEKLLKLSQVG